MRAAAAVAALLGALALTGCQSSRPASGTYTYTVGGPYQTGGIWRYPHEEFSYSETGLASVIARRSGPTADDETYDPTALVAQHRTLQLPAIARVTNLENGRSVLVRLNDRGPEDPHRLIAVSPRVAQLLQAGRGPFRVRVVLQEAESRQLSGGQIETGHLKVDTAPVATVQSEDLAPPPGERASSRGYVVPAAAPVAPVMAAAGTVTVPLRLPEQITQGRPDPGMLYIELGRFTFPQYAMEMAARLGSLGAQASFDPLATDKATYRVRIGPLRDQASAEATLDRALREGVSDARIVVDDD